MSLAPRSLVAAAAAAALALPASAAAGALDLTVTLAGETRTLQIDAMPSCEEVEAELDGDWRVAAVATGVEEGLAMIWLDLNLAVDAADQRRHAVSKPVFKVRQGEPAQLRVGPDEDLRVEVVATDFDVNTGCVRGRLTSQPSASRRVRSERRRTSR